MFTGITEKLFDIDEFFGIIGINFTEGGIPVILRPDYLNALAPFVDVPLVKILSGVRRCGKSTVLTMWREELLRRGIPEERIIERRYTAAQYDGFTRKEMWEDLTGAIRGRGRCYLLLDEVQEIDGWEKVVNALLEGEDVDLYVTGSNSKLMSGEISTYLTGRYVSIPIYTLSFREYLQFKGRGESEARRVFPEYLQYGGFPLIGISSFDTNSAWQVVDGIYSSIITRDIAKRHQIRNQELFDRVVRYVVENVGNTFSANGIVSFLKNEKRSLSVESVYNYLKWLGEAFVIYPCSRYDLQGKGILKTQEKYYLSDISFKYSKLGFDSKMIPAMLENIVFLEMKRRGYEVYVGKNDRKEIDFVGVLRDDRIYVQVCYRLPENSRRETENLMELRDHYHKYVVSMDELAVGNDNGVQKVHIAEFLLMEEW